MTESTGELLTVEGNPGSGVVMLAPRWPLNIHFDGCGSLSPADDITPLEAVHLQMMLACATAGGWNIDYASFIRDKKLERHFK